MEIPDRGNLNNQQHVYTHHQLKLEQYLQQQSSIAFSIHLMTKTRPSLTQSTSSSHDLNHQTTIATNKTHKKHGLNAHVATQYKQTEYESYGFLSMFKVAMTAGH